MDGLPRCQVWRPPLASPSPRPASSPNDSNEVRLLGLRSPDIAQAPSDPAGFGFWEGMKDQAVAGASTLRRDLGRSGTLPLRAFRRCEVSSSRPTCRPALVAHAHRLLRTYVPSPPRAQAVACAHPLACYCVAGHFSSVCINQHDPETSSRSACASLAWTCTAISGANRTFSKICVRNGAARSVVPI